MAVIKSQTRFEFPHGDVWVRMDDEWRVEIVAEDGKGGGRIDIHSWLFNSRYTWSTWGQTCRIRVEDIARRFQEGLIDEDAAIAEIECLDSLMPPHLRALLSGN